MLNLIAISFNWLVKMGSCTSILLYALLAVSYFKESIALCPHLKKSENPKRLPTDEFGKPKGEYYPFMAYFVEEKEYNSEINRTLLGSGVLVTDRHVLTAASVIIEYFKRKSYKELMLLFGGEGSFCRRCRTSYPIGYAQPHPHFIDSEEKPFADIAVVVLASVIPREELSVIQLRLGDVVYYNQAYQLGWDPNATNYCDKYGGACCGTKREFFVSHINDTPSLFESYPRYVATKDDHGGPVYIEEKGKIELIGITSKPSQTRNALHTKIYNFLPFIGNELMNDPVQGRCLPYDPLEWIYDLLHSTIMMCSPETIL